MALNTVGSNRNRPASAEFVVLRVAASFGGMIVSLGGKGFRGGMPFGTLRASTTGSLIVWSGSFTVDSPLLVVQAT
jgi:hypothetical protein